MVVAPKSVDEAAITTIRPSPRASGCPSVVVTIPEPATLATVTLPLGVVGSTALRKVMPGVAGLKLPLGVTITTDAESKLASAACKTMPPEMRLSDKRGMGLPSASTPPAGSVAPMVTCAPGWSSIKTRGATSMMIRPSPPVVTTAPSGKAWPTFDSASLETPSTTTAEFPSACRTVLACVKAALAHKTTREKMCFARDIGFS